MAGHVSAVLQDDDQRGYKLPRRGNIRFHAPTIRMANAPRRASGCRRDVDGIGVYLDKRNTALDDTAP